MEGSIKELVSHRISRAVNTLDGFDSSKHSGVIANFNHNYIKNGTFDKSLSQTIKKASKYREQADYEDFFEATQADASEVYELACAFVETIKKKLVDLGAL